jgi:capsule polysaccharide export protein KpsE/RkpR
MAAPLQNLAQRATHQLQEVEQRLADNAAELQRLQALAQTPHTAATAAVTQRTVEGLQDMVTLRRQDLNDLKEANLGSTNSDAVVDQLRAQVTQLQQQLQQTQQQQQAQQHDASSVVGAVDRLANALSTQLATQHQQAQMPPQDATTQALLHRLTDAITNKSTDSSWKKIGAFEPPANPDEHTVPAYLFKLTRVPPLCHSAPSV